MKQLYFEYIGEINTEVNIELSSAIEEDLTEQMAVFLIQVNKGDIKENDDFTD